MMDLIKKSLDVAKRNELPLRIMYDGKDGITERVIKIRKVGDESVVAYCRLRRRVSTFRIDRILAAEVLYKKDR